MEKEEEENQIKETSVNIPTAPMDETESSRQENMPESEEMKQQENVPEVKKKGGPLSENRLSIHLGDILRVLSPTQMKYHQKTFLVDYCGKEKMRWVDVESGFSYELKLTGKNHEDFEEKEGIFSIELLSRETYPGYARQNSLEPGVWVDVEFGGDVPFIVTGLITNLEEDQIEITLWPNQETFYLDFQYEGVLGIEPIIEKIQIRDAPSLEAEKVMESLRKQWRKPTEEIEEEMSGLIDGEQEEITNLTPSLEREEAETNQLEKLRDEYVQGTAFAKSILPEIEYGEVLGNYYQRVEQRKEEMRYSLNAQIEDFMNELLSTIPNYMRTPAVMEEVEHTLQRFRELHTMFSKTNDSGVVVGYRSNRYRSKPLVSGVLGSSGGGSNGDGTILGKWQRNTGWIVPVTYLRKKGWHDLILEKEDENFNASNNDEDGYFNAKENRNLYEEGKEGSGEWIENPACVWLKGIQESVDKWLAQSGTKTANHNGYRRLLKELDEAMRPAFPFTKKEVRDTISGGRNGEESLGEKIVGLYECEVPTEAVVDNTPFRMEGVFGNRETDGFYSTVSRGGYGDKLVKEDVQLERRRFVVQKHVDSVSLLTMRWSNSGKKVLERETVVENEKMMLKSVLLLPEAWMAFSRVGLPGTDVLTRSRLGSWWPQLSRVLNQYTSVENVVVDDLTKDYAYSNVSEKRCGISRVMGRKNQRYGFKGGEMGEEEEGEGAMGDFLSGVREYVLAKENLKTAGTVSQPLETLLNTVIPNNLYLIDFMCPYLEGKQYSLTHYAQLLEPFNIYPWNMRYAESNVMQKKIRDKIAEYRVKMESARKEYGAMEEYFKKNGWEKKYRTVERFFHWFRTRGDEFMNSFMGWYHLNVGPLTTSEILARIYAMDDGQLMAQITSYLNYALISLNRFSSSSSLKKGGSGMGGVELGEVHFGFSGGNRNLSKRYHSVSELHDDNHRTDLHWNRELDNSPYYLVEQYGGETGGEIGGAMDGNIPSTPIAINLYSSDSGTGFESGKGINGNGGVVDAIEGMEGMEGGAKATMRQKLTASEFLEYLAMNLKERHFCPAEDAIELASRLISGKRPVKEGDYASVLLGNGDVGYYRRKHHTWLRDDLLDFNVEGQSEKDLFCNLKKARGGLGVKYAGKDAKEGGGEGIRVSGDGTVDGREVVSLSGNMNEERRIAAWENRKMNRNASKMFGGAAKEEESEKREKEVAKELFQQRVQESLKEWEATFEKKMAEQVNRSMRIYALKQTELKRANTFAYHLGKYKKETDTRLSPHSALLELVLEEPDFDLKQKYIVRFYHAFCREPILTGGVVDGLEKPYWKYCSETNVPLLPTSYFELALEYTKGGNYDTKLELLCSQIGDKSSDGEAIIDKFTGRVLKKLDLDVEEGYDEMGFQRKTREVMLGSGGDDEPGDLGESSAAEGNRVREEERHNPGKEEGDMMDEEEEGEYLKRIDEVLASGSGAMSTSSFSTTTTATKRVAKTAQDYGEGENEMIARVSLYFLQAMGLISADEWVDDLMAFVLPLVSDLLVNKEFIETEKRFEQKRKLAMEKGKTFPFASYEMYKNHKLLYAAMGATLIGIQTVTAEVKLSRNMTNCIRSLKGYPTGLGGSGKDDTTALRYMACLLIQQQSDEAPWNARNKGKKEDTQMNVLMEYVDKFLLGNRAVEDRIGAKRAYEVEHGTGFEETVPRGLRIEHKSNLLPPMEKGLRVEDREIMPVSRDFLEEWKSEIRRALKAGGKRTTGSSEFVVRAKLGALGYSVFEHINTEVARQVRDFLMKTVLGEAFLENACCQGRGKAEGAQPLMYFAGKNPLIAKSIKTSRLLERALETSEAAKKSVLLYHAESTRIGNGEFWDRGNGSSYFKENIYDALIRYFNYDRPLLPVPQYLRGTVYEEPPKNYPVGALLKEKIEFLERAGRHYDVEKLQHCLMLIGRQNILSSGTGGTMVNREMAAAADSGETENTKIGEALGDFLASSVFEMPVGSVTEGAMNTYTELLQKLTDVFRDWKRGTMQNSASPRIRALNSFLAKSNAAMFDRISKEWRPTDDKERSILAFLERVQLWNLAGDIEREQVNRANSDSLQQIVRFIRDMCSMFAFIYMKRIGAIEVFNSKKKAALPKHWGFAEDHYKLLKDYISKTFGSLARKRDSTDDVLYSYFELLSTNEKRLFSSIRQLMEFFPVFTPLSLVVGENGEKEVFYSLFPKETCYGIHVFCLYLILTRMLDVSKSYEITILDVDSRKKGRVRDLGSRRDYQEDLVVSLEDSMATGSVGGRGRGGEEEMAVEEYYSAARESIEDRQGWEGRSMVLREKIRQFVYDCLEVERDNKQVVDMSYEDLKRKQEETEKREKKRITDRLKKMEIYERRVENQMKDLKLGNWNVGQQKGLFQYDKETFKREVMEQQYGLTGGLEEDFAEGGGRVGALYDTERDVDLAEDYLNGEEADRLRDMEMNGEIMALGEDWDDGGGYE